MPYKEAASWVCLTMFGAAVYFLFDWWGQDRIWVALIVAVIALIGLGYLVYQYHRPEAKLPSTGIWVWLPLVITWCLFAYVIYEEHHAPIPPLTVMLHTPTPPPPVILMRSKAQSDKNKQKSAPATQPQAPVKTGPVSTGDCSNVQIGGSGNQGTTNCGPPPLVLTVASIETAGKTFGPKEGFLETEITIVPNQQVTAPFTIALEFDNPISVIGHTVKNVAAQMGGGAFRIGTHARDSVLTNIGPSHPLIVVVYSLQPVKLVAEPKIEF